MEYRDLGQTGLKVSRLCFGSLTLSPLQANLGVKEGAGLIAGAMERGINFLDTAELYDNYGYIKEAMKGRPRSSLIIATKTYAYSRKMARESLEKALKEMGLDYIDIFMLHEQESALTLKGHREAMEYFLKAKDKGYIRAFGVSTHHVECVRAATEMEEIQVIHPLVNIRGLGIADGSVEDMLTAIGKAHYRGKGIYAMKPLGGGNLIENPKECFDFVLGIPHISSVAVGIQSVEELETDIAIFENRPVDPGTESALSARRRRLLIEPWCEGCGSCVSVCSQGALYLKDGKACVRQELCILCGYCAVRCKNFFIKVV
ncbi:MAG: aldo/keto reductase [Clostridia bacterium]|jgi:aryl-alcohol dehydrogenase-like predicted oxidoreductase|nr:aldo/keto reductase [Clostridiales bacterium]